MKKATNLSLLLVLSLLFGACQSPWHALFNGENLDGWETHIGTPLTGFDDLHAAASPENVFSIEEIDGEKVILIAGTVNGAIATIDTFSNYHLELVFKWGDKVYTKRNSGLLYHSFGEFGDAHGTWMTNIECQLMHEKLGDTYLMNNTCCETTAEAGSEGFVYSPTADLKSFGKAFEGAGIKKAVDAENPLGEWNTVELYSVGRTTAHVVNGKTVMVNTNTGIFDDGKIKPLQSGKIQIQSEGAALYVKSVRIQTIKEIPGEILQ